MKLWGTGRLAKTAIAASNTGCRFQQINVRLRVHRRLPGMSK